MIKPIKIVDMPKRELVKPKPILPNMVPGHWRQYKSGPVFVAGYFRRPRKKNMVYSEEP